MKTRTLAALGTLALSASLLAGCSSVTSLPAPTPGTIVDRSGGLNGYQHGFEGSALALGGHPKRVAQYGYLKQVGDEGTEAIRLSNGSTFGVPNASAPALHSRPYGTTPEDHDRFVKDYFVHLGVPTAQIARVRTLTLLSAHGSTQDFATAKPVVAAYYSVLERAADGIAIPDSFAWARVTADGKVVAEGVYWPALSRDVLVDARRFRDTLSDQDKRSGFESRIASNGNEGRVTIRHTSAFAEAPFEAFASFDVNIVATATQATAANAANTNPSSAGAAGTSRQIVVRHYDETGAEKFLAQERRDLTAQSKPRARKSAN